MKDFQPCPSSPCPSYGPGHNVHWIQLKQAGLVPWNWRDGIVERIDSLAVTVRYLAVDHAVELRHHKALDAWLQPGDPVGVHERFHLLLAGDMAFSVHATGALGEVPEPDEHLPGPVLVADLATGHGRGGFPRLA